MISITELYLYPVKSCRGLKLDVAEIVPGGIKGDRRFMVVDGAGLALTARVEPRLLLVAPQLNGDRLRLEAPALSALELFSSYSDPPARRMEVKIWRDLVESWEIPEASQWFSSFLGQSVHFVYQPEAALRPVNPARSLPGDVVHLADAYPLLLANTASLDDLNLHTSVPVAMDRFRPNIVIGGAPAYAEDTWQQVKIAQLEFESPKLCDRCVLTTVDPQTAERGREPLRALAQHRRWDNAVWFATNLIPRGRGMLRVGDQVIPLSKRPHPRDEI